MFKILSIAGSDCSGGAGVQADIKTVAAHGMYGMSVITALTAQNTTGVFGVQEADEDFVGMQMDAVFSDIFPDAVKIGMVSSAGLIRVIAEKLRRYNVGNIVVDPVMVSTSGSKLLSDGAVEALTGELFPLARLVTPNLRESEALCGMEVATEGDMINATEMICKTYYNCAVLVKGGHSAKDATDILYDDGRVIRLHGKRIDNRNTHGTGCTLSTAIACRLAEGRGLEESVRLAKGYLTKALEAMLDLGAGSGPLDHNVMRAAYNA